MFVTMSSRIIVQCWRVVSVMRELYKIEDQYFSGTVRSCFLFADNVSRSSFSFMIFSQCFLFWQQLLPHNTQYVIKVHSHRANARAKISFHLCCHFMFIIHFAFVQYKDRFTPDRWRFLIVSWHVEFNVFDLLFLLSFLSRSFSSYSASCGWTLNVPL